MRFRWDHLHLRSPDPDKTAAFYKTMFAAEEQARTENGEQLRVAIELAGMPLFIDRVPPGTGAPPEAPFLGFEHIGLTVDDIDATVTELRGRGVEILVEPHNLRPDLRIAFLRGPENVRIELLQRG